MILMHKLLNEHARFIYRGTPFLLFCEKSSKYQNTDVFKFYCITEFVYVYRIIASTANIGNLFEKSIHVFKLLKIILSKMFDMQY